MRDDLGWFRAKRLQGENWIEGYFYRSDINERERNSGKATLIFTPDCDTFIFVPKWHNSFMVIADTVGERTGLNDKNGVPIYEGDIVRYTFDSPEDPTATENGLKLRIGRVFWSEWRAAWAVSAGRNGSTRINSDMSRYVRGRGLYEYVRGANTVEVIGNIHDNPELIGGDGDG